MILKHKQDPLLFQGKNKNEKYFEGWYFKQSSSDLNHIVSIIPGISKGSKDSHAFIQVIILDKLASNKILQTHYHKFSINDFKYSDEPFCLMIGNNTFSNERIKLDLKNEQFSIRGSIYFCEFTTIKRNIFAPNIMGFFAYFKFMECYHDIISMNHHLNGTLKVNNINIDFNSGKGYIEKDWGTSFPKKYIWLQSNHFVGTDTSIMLSIAHIPFLKTSFQGFICCLTFNKREYRFTTYNKSKIAKISCLGNQTEIIIVNGKYELIIKAEITQLSGELKAPDNGSMENMIKEGLTGTAYIKFKKNSKILFEGKGSPCAIEIHNY